MTKGKREQRADRVAALAGALQVPRSELAPHPALTVASAATAAPRPQCRFYW